MILVEETRHSRKEIKLRAEEMATAGGKARGKSEIRSGPAFAFKLLYNCILRGTKSDGDLRDVITDERLYKKLPILVPSLSSAPVGRESAAPAPCTGFSFSPFRLSTRSSFPPFPHLARSSCANALLEETRFCHEQKWRMKE